MADRVYKIPESILPTVTEMREWNGTPEGKVSAVRLPKGNTKNVNNLNTAQKAEFYFDEALRMLALANYYEKEAE